MRYAIPIRQAMTTTPLHVTSDTRLDSVARLMANCNLGEVIICDDGKVTGVITDRDITCRAIAFGKNPTVTTAGEIMTAPAVTVGADEPLDRAIELMEQERIRRIPVIEADGKLVGILSQVDIAMKVSEGSAGHLLAAGGTADFVHQLTRSGH
jgi:CBS domain-containing protein